MGKLEKLIADIENVRNASDLTRSQQLSALRGTDNLFAPDYESFILDMPSDQWQRVSGEAKNVLEKVLAGTVAAGQEGTIADQVPQLVDPSLSVEEAALVNALAKPFIVANLEVDDAKTAKAKEDARAAITPVRCLLTRRTR